MILIGAVAAVIAAGLMSRSDGAERRRATGWLVAELTSVRIEAMRAGRAAAAWVECDGERLSLTAGDQRTEWPAPGLWLVDERGKRVSGVRVRFEPSGRAQGGPIDFEVRSGESADSLGGAGGRMGMIEFDPVSGAVCWRPDGQPGHPVAGAVEEIEP